VGLGLSGTRARAASWDPFPGVAGPGDGVVNGGSGNWDLTTANWTLDGGLSNQPWINFDVASFGGATGGVVTLAGGGGVSAASVTFDPTSDGTTYVVQGQTALDTLTLAGSGQVVTNQDATIAATIGGSVGLTKLGGGALTLSGANAFTGPVSLLGGGRLRLANTAALGFATNLVLDNGGVLDVTTPLTFGGGVQIGSAGATIALSNASAAVTLAGPVSGNGAMIIDGAGGGSLNLTSPANFDGASNGFTGNVLLLNGGSASLGYTIAAPAGQTFLANAGTLNLGNSVQGATVTLGASSSVQALGAGVVQIGGRAATAGVPGVGVTVAGDLYAQFGGRVVVGDGLDDSGQIAFVNTSNLVADGGTIVVRPRGATPLAIDASSVNSIAIRNGGVFALAGTSDLVLNRDVDQSGAWTLANQSAGNTLRIAAGSQDSTAGLTLRAEGGLIRYETDAINVGGEAVNGTLGVELRGGTVDINNGSPGKVYTYSPGYTVGGWGQLGTSAANQTHVIPAGGATFYASGPSGTVLSVVGGYNESQGSKAQYRIGDNDGLMLTVPNSAGSPYSVGGVAIDPQGFGSVARFVVGAGGAISANTAAFANPNNHVRFEVQSGATLVSDVSQTGSLLVNTPGSTPISVSGGTFVTTSPTFLLKAGETIGSSGTLFGPNTNLTLNGTLDLNGMLGASINAASTGTIRLDAGETLTLTAAADLSNMTLGYAGGASAPATLETNAVGTTTRIGVNTALATPFDPFGGTREFRVTSGTLQVDAADPTSATITGFNQLSVNRGGGGVTLVGTLTLNGGSFQIGTTAATTTVTDGAFLRARGQFGHGTTIDTFVNNGTVQASGGPLTVIGSAIRGVGTYDPNGQTILLTGTIQNTSANSPTTLRIASASGGKVQLEQANTYSGGTVLDGSAAGGTPVTLRVIAAGAIGSGPVTLNSGFFQINTDASLNFGANAFNVIGSGPSTINYDHIAQTGGRTQTIGALTFGGQTLNLAGPPTSAYNYTLTIGGTTLSAAGGSLINTGSSPVNTGPLTLNGNLTLQTSSFNFTIGALSGSGSITRSAASGTLNFNRSSAGYTGNLFTSVGTTSFSAANVLGTGTYTFGGGTININAGGAGALSGATGTMQGGQFNLVTANALDGTNLSLTGGNLTTSTANALGSGVIQLAGGKLFLKSDAGATFGGTINVTGGVPGSLTVDRTGSGTGGVHTINALNLSNQQLLLVAPNAGYGLNVTGGTTVSGAAGSNIDNNAAQLMTPTLVLNGSLSISGTGLTTVGQLGGAGGLTKVSSGVLTINGAPMAGFASAVAVNGGTVNVNNAPSFAGGSVSIGGGTLNLGLANALANTSIALNSGFLNANAPNALANVTLPISNGTLFANANNALANATVNMSGGNVTATAPNALGSSNINLGSNAILALRGDASAAFGGNVAVTGSGFSTISVAKLTDGGGTGSTLSINSLALGGQTLNVTGADNAVFSVINPIALAGSSPTTINTTAADALFSGALSGASALVKNGVRTLTLDGGANVPATTVNAGTLVVNNAFTSGGVAVGGVNGPASLVLGGGGVNSPGNVTVNAGLLRITKANIANAVPPASVLNVGTNGDVTVEYGGFSAGTLANNINVDTSGGARTLTLSADSGSTAAQASTFTVGGLIVRSGANALNVVALADRALDDGFGNLVRPPSRLIMSGAQTFTTDLQFAGGIVIAKGNLPAGATAGPFGQGGNPLALNVMDSTVGDTVADGQSAATFSRVVTTNAASPRKRLGAFFNPAGAAGTQTINFNGSFTWNDGTLPLYVITPSGNAPGAAMGTSTWNGLIVDPGTVLQVNGGAALDNILTSTPTAVTSVAPVYVGGGGTVRFTTGLSRDLTQAKGLAGTVTVLDNTTFQSNTGGQHFDGVELRTGTYQVGVANQTIAGGLAVNPSPFEPARSTSSVVTDFDLTLTGTGTAAAFKIAGGQTLAKSGVRTLNVNGDQLHGPGSMLQVNQGTVNLNTDAGMNNGGVAQNNLSVTVNSSATVNFAVTQHLAQLIVGGGGLAKLNNGVASGARVLDTTAVNASGGKLDLTNNRLIVDYAGASPLASIRQQIISGYAGGTWNGNGIVSSTAAANASVMGIGYGEASALSAGLGGVFGSETVDNTSVLVRYTKLGDATLDGVVDFNDLVKLAQNYNTTVAGATDAWWTSGDFNYDGVVDFNDLVRVAQNYNTALAGQTVPAGASAAFEADLAAAFTQAPEPGTVGVLSLAGMATLLKRQRRAR